MHMTQMEEYAVVLDYLPYGKSTDTTKEPLTQVLGETYFTILEVVPKAGTELKIGERVYIGKNERDKIDHIKTRISFYDLTSGAKTELPLALTKIVKAREVDYVGFFNKCGPVTIRLHQLELLPGIGKKHMLDLLKEREKKPFASFDDMRARVALLPDPIHLIAQRIEEELKGASKYYILTRPPQQPRQF
ncbi:MAG: DUF655 domain-containing protein [Candidatus Micrarchaeota archaeon]